MEKAAKGRYSRVTCRLFFFCWLFFYSAQSTLSAQNEVVLKLLPLDREAAWLSEQYPLQESYADSAGAAADLAGLLHQLHSQAFLEASVDSLDCRDSLCLAILHIGPQYEWARLERGNVPEEFLNQSGFRERLFNGRPFSYPQLRKIQENLLTFAENNGYPFASVWLDSIRIRNSEVSASLHLERGDLILIDTLAVTGNASISQAYLRHYLGLHPGSPYSRSRIVRSRDRLRELPFLRLDGDPEVTFQGDRASLNFPLEKKNASRFDFLIGVLPNSNQTGRMLITGNFEGELINQFGLGERIYGRFEQLRPQTQELHLAFSYPYVLGMPLGTDIDFSLYKRDTTFLDLVFNLGISYLLEGGDYLKGYWEQRSSTLLNIDEEQLLETQRLPASLDVGNSIFGLEMLVQNLDYRYNPRRGWHTFLRGGAGIKNIRRNSQIEALELGYLYDSLELRSFQYRLESELAGFLPLFSRSTVMARAKAGFIFSQNPVYQNEQFRIGGNQLLRGFDEEFIFATHFAVSTLEYRLLLGQNSFLYLFGDYAWVLDETTETNRTIHPYGFGTGITFETSVGIFGVSLAFGAIPEDEQPVDFASPKVHFGYVSRF